jgi:hypothetical protein
MRTFTLRQLHAFVLVSAAYLAVFRSWRDSTWRDGLGWGWADTVVVVSWVLLSATYVRWRLKVALVAHVLVFWLPFLLLALLWACEEQCPDDWIEPTLSAEWLGCFFATFISFPIACLAIVLRGLVRSQRRHQESLAR